MPAPAAPTATPSRPLEEFERAYEAALASKRPSVIDAKITRLALPHYSPSPEGTIAGILELIEARFRGGS